MMYGRFGRSVRPARKFVAVVLSGGLGTTLALVAPSLAAAGYAANASMVDAAEPLQRTDAASASALARQTGRDVEVLSLRTEYEEHYARPDGNFSLISYASPVRVRQGDGWVPLDPTLRRAEGQVVPAATLSDLRFSDGGSGPLATIGKDGRQVAVWWPQPLPTPTISGDTATYANVFPGVDLQMRARDDGYSQVLVVHTRDAAKNPALQSITQRTSGVGLTLRQGMDGSVAAVDGSGTPAFISPASFMWDSSGPEEQGTCGEPAADRQTPIPVRVTDATLTIVPDAAMLTSPETVFPVCIDPSFSGATDKWTHVFKAAPNTSYWGNFRSGMRVGREWEGGSSDIWRTFVRINIGGIVGTGAQILSASFFSRLDHSASCSPTSIELWHTGFVSPNDPPTTWNNSAGSWSSYLAVAAGNANETGGCGELQGDMTMEWGGNNLRNSLQGMANGSFGIMTFGMRVPAAYEGDDSKWKIFYPADSATTSQKTYLSVVYNHPPNVPTGQKLLTSCASFCASPTAVVRSGQPTIEALVTDRNGDAMRVEYEVYNDAQTSRVAFSGTTVSNAGNNTAPDWTITPALSDSRYHWRVRACDAFHCGGFSGWFTFTVDTQPPPAPQVNSTFYRPKSTGTWNGGVGVPGVFTFDPVGSTDVYAYEWRWLDGAVSSVPATGVTPVSVSLPPPGDLEQVLQVRTADQAGNVNTSGWVSYAFYVKPATVDKGYWKFDEGSGSTAAAADGGTEYTGVLTGGATWATGINGSAASLDGTDDYVLMPTVLDTANVAGFSVSAWVYLTDTSAFRTAIAQDGVNDEIFRLYFKPDANGGAGGWCFSLRGSDDPAGDIHVNCSSYPVRTHTWVYLVGVYDPNGGAPKLRLYVDGGPNNGEPVPGTLTVINAPAAWASTGSFNVGRSRNGASGWNEYWQGRVDEVRAYQRVLPEVEVRQTFQSCLYATCPPIS
jgi:hypothetical protein